MTTTRRVNELTLVSDITDGDILVGERVNGTTVRIPYAAPIGVSDGDKGDITVSSSGTVYTIDNDVVTYAKMQNVSATDKLLGRSSVGSGDVEEIALTSAGRALIDDTDASAQRTTLGLGTLATQNGTFSGASSGTNTGDQTITLTGNVTGSGTGSFAATIATSAVTLAKMADIATSSLIYRKTAGTGAPEVNTLATLKTDLLLTGTNSGDQTITLTGDVTGSGTGSFATTIANDAVTYAKMQNVSATARIMGRNTAGSGDMEELDASTVKTMLSLNNVENTALSTWAGSTAITTLGTITSGTWNGTAITVAYGGSGRASATAYAPIVGGTSSTGAHQSSASGSTGQIYQSAGNAAVPTWSTPTYPSTSGTSGKFLISDGTNNVYSTSTIPTSAGATANKVLLSDGTNYVLSTPTFPNASATSGKRIKSDGTNWIASTTTMPDTGTSRKMLVGDGTNYVESTETWAVPGSSGNVLRSDGTNWTAAKVTLTTDVTGVLPVANGGTNASSASITAFNNITGYSAAGSTGTTSTNLVFSTSPTLVTPALGTVASGVISACTSTSMVMVTPVLGTPTSGALTNCTSIPVAQATGILPRANGGDVTMPTGRLTLVTVTPVMTSDQAAKTTIYYSLYNGNVIPLYDGTNFVNTVYTELSVLTTDTTKSPAAIGASKVNDWFIWSDSGTIRLSHGPDWTNDTTRAAGTALTLVNGIYLNNASLTNGPAASRGTYVGTTRSNASSQLDWILGGDANDGSPASLFVWNMYNRVNVGHMIRDTRASHSWTTASFQGINGTTGMRLTYVQGLNEESAVASYTQIATSTTNGTPLANGIGIDSTTVNSGNTGYTYFLLVNTNIISGTANWAGTVGLGVHYIAALEYGGTNASQYGFSDPAQNGMNYLVRM